MNGFDLLPLLPELFLALTAMGLLMVGMDKGNDSTPIMVWASVAALIFSGGWLFGMDWEPRIVMNGMFVFDSFAGMSKLLIVLGLVGALSLSVQYLRDARMESFEYPILILLAGLGMMIMVSSNHFLTLYMGLELQSLSLYILAAFNRNAIKSSEAGVKYFVLGALSSGLLLFGISLIYGFTGALNFEVIAETLAGLDAAHPGVTFGLVFILAGMAFKISAVPFHMWTPDVYQGSPTSVTALFAMVPKLAAMALLLRLAYGPFGSVQGQWVQIIIFIAFASMLLGAFAALSQSYIKRLLAYSTIGHMGYALIGLATGTLDGASSLIAYMVIYMISSAGVFAIVLSMRRGGIATDKIDDLAGLSRNAPIIAYSMAILMLSMAGIPPLAGFFGKLFVFQAAIAEQLYILAVIGVLSSVVAAYYYLRIIKVMFFDEPADAFDPGWTFPRRAVLFISILFVLTFMFYPSFVMDSIQGAVSVLFNT